MHVRQEIHKNCASACCRTPYNLTHHLLYTAPNM